MEPLNKHIVMKKILSFVFMSAICCAHVFSQDYSQYHGICGDNLTWRINTPVYENEEIAYWPIDMSSGDTLYIEGYGDMYNYKSRYNGGNAPWLNNYLFANIRYVYFSKRLKTIGSYAFEEMQIEWTIINDGIVLSHSDVYLPDSVTSIGNYAFCSCQTHNIVIPNSVTHIGKYAFLQSQIHDVTISENVTEIGLGAFRYCKNLQEINVDINNANYSSVDGALFDKGMTTLIQYPGGKYVYDGYTVPNGVTTIDRYALAYTNLEIISIPGSVNNIGNYAFSDSQNLQSINVAQDNLNYSSTNGVLFDKTKDSLITYPMGRHGVYSIPDGTRYIKDGAFIACKKMTAVIFPSSLIKIGTSAFMSCESLVSIDLPDGITEIQPWAFSSCTNLSFINFGKSIADIGQHAFAYCSALQSVAIPKGVIALDRTFVGCNSLNTVSIPSTVNSIGEGTFMGCSNLTTIYNHSFTPQIIPRRVFVYDDESLPNCTLYVPEKSVELYQTTDVWKEFSPILPIQNTEGVDHVNSSVKYDTSKLIHNGQIYILRGEKVYTLQGQEVK